VKSELYVIVAIVRTYRVLVRGRNCFTELDGRVQRLGFYATPFCEAVDEEDAGRRAIALVRAEPEGSFAQC
jgi:hypothetical protein